MRVYEIESKNGSTLCAFRVDDNGGVIETSKNVTHHDSDGDYYLSVTPVTVNRRENGSIMSVETTAFSGTKMLIKEVNRRSKKRSQEALEIAEDKKEELIEYVIADQKA
jgi:hypothetical protein